jgi:RNA polymerase sigma-70 factor (ECF subfamily)
MSSAEDGKSLPGFEELAMPLFDSLYNFARWMAHNQTDAEDLVQETYLKALRGFTSFQPGTNFRAWMFRILKNTFLSSCSKLERRMTSATESEENFPVLPATSDTPESLLIARFDNDAVQCAIGKLPAIFREVILLCDVEDASYREIAEILSIPIGTVMSRLARARKLVREALGSAPGAPRSAEGERGAMREVFIDQDIAAERDRLQLDCQILNVTMRRKLPVRL